MFNEQGTIAIERPFTYSPEQLGDIVKKLGARGMEILDEYIRTKDKEAELIRPLYEAVHDIDPTINGNIEPLVEDLALMRQESHAKKEWSAWEYISSIPGKLWDGVKAHPKITAAVVMTGMIAAAYYTGAFSLVIERIKGWAIANGVGQFFGQASEMAAGGIEAVKDGAAVVADKAAAGLEVAKDAAAGAVESAEAALGSAAETAEGLVAEGTEAAQAAGQAASEAAQGAADAVTGTVETGKGAVESAADKVVDMFTGGGAADAAVEGAGEAAGGLSQEAIDAATEAYNADPGSIIPPPGVLPPETVIPNPGVLPPEGLPVPEVMPEVPTDTIPNQVPSLEDALDLLDQEK